jgi:hypothetical protein
MTDMVVIPDAQNAPGHPTDHLVALSNYLMYHKPSWVHDLGDWNDNKAAGRYESDAAKGLHERDVMADLKWAKDCNDILWSKVDKHNRKANRQRRYEPRKTRTLGNHEQRLNRLIEKEPWLKGLIFNENNFNEKKHGIECFKFLEIISISGVWFSHYFPQSADGNVKQMYRGQSNARLQVQRLANSSIAGHNQGMSTHLQTTPAKRMRGVIAGSFYQHDEDYMGEDGNNYWRGILHLRNMKNGDFDMQDISIESLMRDYA